MDADATASLHKKGIAATDDSFKFTWFQVCFLVEFSVIDLGEHVVICNHFH